MSSVNPTEATGLCPEQVLFYKRVERAEKFVRHLWSSIDSYHNHKENLAHAALVVMEGLVVGVLTRKQWPPTWIPDLELTEWLCPQWAAFIGFGILWLLLHIYMRWQLRKRRWAAIMSAGASRALSIWAMIHPAPGDLEPYPGPGQEGGQVWTILDHIVIVPKAPLPSDVEEKDYPTWFVAAVLKQKGTGAIEAEGIVTLGSYFLLLLVIARTFGEVVVPLLIWLAYMAFLLLKMLRRRPAL